MARPDVVASDIDGTLLDPDDRIPDANRAVIAELVADGATFVLATGRPPRWLDHVVEQLDSAPLAVCANGAVALDTATGEHLRSHLLAPEVLAQIDDVLAHRLPGCGIAAERFGVDAADAEFVASPDYRHAWLQPEHLSVGHAEVLGLPALKLLARMPGWDSEDMVRALGDELRDLADITYSTTNGLIEFSVKGVTKASALAQLIAHRQRANQDSEPGAAPFCVAFGDMPNDIEMLRWADHGVAMGNAMDSVKQVADEVTTTNARAGVAHVLRRWWP